MLLIVSDACVLIDMECAELTSAMFSLPYTFAVPDILFEEELSERHSHLLQAGLLSQPMSEELTSEVFKLYQQHKKLSFHDVLAFVLARHHNSRLLTGDKALRELAKDAGLLVNGTIWLIEQMIEHDKVSVEDARKAFQRMKTGGSRLPWKEVEAMLDEKISVINIKLLTER